MNGVMTAQKEKLEEKPNISLPDKYKLIDNDNSRFIQDSSYLLTTFYIMLDNVDAIINNEGKLRNSAYDYKRLNLIKNIFAANINNPQAMIEMLNSHLSYIKKYNKELAQLILQYSPARAEQNKKLIPIAEILGNTSNLSANIDILLENAEKIENEELKSKVKNRLMLIKRYSDEIGILNYDAEDAMRWNLHVHSDILFFTERVEAYFKGSATSDRNQFRALDEFKDEKLKKAVIDSREVKTLYYLSQFLHDVEGQRGYISKLIAYIQQDINKKGSWERDIATGEFVKKIEKYASVFKETFKNALFANSLVKNTAKIGEQPFVLIRLLEKMDKALENSVPKKNMVIENAKNYIYSVFRRKEAILRSLLEKLELQIRQLLGGIDASVIKKIEEGIKDMEKVINRVWKERRKRFKNMKNRIDDKNLEVQPKVKKLVEAISISSETKAIAERYIPFVEFSKHAERISTGIKVPTTKHFPYLGMLAFDYARMGEFVEDVNKLVDAIKQKHEQSKKLDLTETKKFIKDLVDMYFEFLNWLKSVSIIDAKSYEVGINKFIGDYYGR